MPAGEKETRNQLDQRLTAVVPSQRQLALEQMEFYAFIHFTVNTYTGREWGDGTEDPAIFNPVDFDPNQWVRAVKSAGMTGLILTCKHHDGFCLWPSRYTTHTVAASPYPGDIVAETAEACRKEGVRFGIYLSPWDRNQPCYGSGKAYDDFFVNQLTELLTGYGEIFAVWLDGACGEGPNGRVQAYDWERYYAVIRRLQPNACIHVCGPDVRWCGNEAGSTRPSEWSVVPRRTRDTEKIAQNSQRADNKEFRQRKLSASDLDLGSREVLRDEEDLIWYPAEVNTSIRPGWFYHPEEDVAVKSPEELLDVYLRSVGGNSSFLLNIPPTPKGLLHSRDRAVLEELGERLRAMFAHNLAAQARFWADCAQPGYEIDKAREDGYQEWFRTPEGRTACRVTVEFPQETPLSYLVLKEYIPDSQRIERFRVADGEGRLLYEGTVVGYKKIVPLPAGTQAKTLAVEIEDARRYVTLSFLGIY